MPGREPCSHLEEERSGREKAICTDLEVGGRRACSRTASVTEVEMGRGAERVKDDVGEVKGQER